MSDNIAAIAEGLTEAQRRAVLKDPCGQLALSDSIATVRVLWRRDLIARRGYLAPLTPLGLAVREHLKARNSLAVESNHAP